MKRGQVLSLDALLSLVIVVMVIGVVINTNDIIKAEITNLVEWYDRANIANNMLDILTKSPGYPKDWEESNVPLKVLGLVSLEYPAAVDYNKIVGLSERVYNNDSSLIDSLENLSSKKDFMVDIYLRQYSIDVSGFPVDSIYIVVGSPDNNVNFRLSDVGNSPFDVVCGSVKLNGEPFPPTIGNAPVDLNPGDVVEFIPTETVYVYSRNTFLGTIPANSTVIVEAIDEGSELQVQYFESTCRLHFTGIGRVYVIVKAYSAQAVTLTYDFTPASNATTPFLRIVMINGSIYAPNGSLYTYNDAILSMNNSQWVETSKRVLSMARRIYRNNITLTSQFKGAEPLIIGKLKVKVPEYAYLNITLNGEIANVSLLAINGETIRGVFAYKVGNFTEALILKNNTIENTYSGDNGNVLIPLSDIFPNVDIAELYLISFEGESLYINNTWNLDAILVPKIEACKLKIWVWDDR
ncbi:MAG: hypothetical protein H0Z18_07665 [Thermococcus sp.]|uniref:hypothetical protein n=1 Tax=Thermococcus sp. TaxID=35749 RepID=UPI001D471C40|nr:hypothetical protein [Thermococcus sp.]MBO8175118.1 hypothetical protein [Thermococcus sp.]